MAVLVMAMPSRFCSSRCRLFQFLVGAWLPLRSLSTARLSQAAVCSLLWSVRLCCLALSVMTMAPPLTQLQVALLCTAGDGALEGGVVTRCERQLVARFDMGVLLGDIIAIGVATAAVALAVLFAGGLGGLLLASILPMRPMMSWKLASPFSRSFAVSSVISPLAARLMRSPAISPLWLARRPSERRSICWPRKSPPRLARLSRAFRLKVSRASRLPALTRRWAVRQK